MIEGATGKFLLQKMAAVAEVEAGTVSGPALRRRLRLQSGAVCHCGPLQRRWRSAASQRRAAASSLRYRSADCWRRPAALSTQAPSPPSRERRPAALNGAFAALSIDAVQLRGADPPHWFTRLPASAAVATSREYRHSPRSGSGRADSPKSVMAWVLSMAVNVPPDRFALVHRAWLALGDHLAYNGFSRPRRGSRRPSAFAVLRREA